MNLMKIYNKAQEMMTSMTDVSLLIVRLLLAYGFYEPAMMKLKNVSSIADWFGTMGIPLPTLNAYMATGTEVLGVILLILGLGTRLISIPLIVVMIVAIVTVHLSNGFVAGNNGFEIPMYYMAMLLVLVSSGGGKLSIDYLISRKK